MPYDSIPRVGAGYVDGAFLGNVVSTQPRILILGTAKKGLSYELYQVSSVGAAEKTFGKRSEMMRLMHEAVGQGADNIALMRIGGTGGQVVLTAATGETLTITTEYRDDQILDRYVLIIEPSSIDTDETRVLIYDAVSLQYVYDSDEIIVLDTGVIDVEGAENWPVANITYDSAGNPLTSTDVEIGTLPVTALRLGTTAAVDLEGREFNAIKSAGLGLVTASDLESVSSLTKSAGSDGTGMSAVQRYACLEYAYQLLDFRDADIVLPAGVYHDMPNIVTGTEDDTGTATATITVSGVGGLAGGGTLTLTNSAGVGVVFTEDNLVLPGGGTATIGTSGLTTAEEIAIEIESSIAGEGTFTVTRVGTTLYVTSDAAGPTGNQVNVSAITDVATTNFTGGDAADSWDSLPAATGSDLTGITVGATPKAAPTYAGSASFLHHLSGMRADSEEDFLGYVWQYRYRGKIYTFFADDKDLTSASTNVVGHNELTGDEVPAAVYAKFNDGNEAELRECNFSHQLASFCYRASTNWSQMMGIISTEVPRAFSRAALRDHAGELPEYSVKGADRVVDDAADNGEGLLGDKFLAGTWNFRNGAIDAADKDATDGIGWGGLILTIGASLPNGEPYGIDDSDEALDSNDRPIDIGKHILVCYDWPLLISGYNGGSTYCHSLVGSLAGKLATTPENVEPIGTNGVIANIVRTRKWHISQINDLAFIRAVGLRLDDTTGQSIIVSSKTAAHPTSDYSRISTIRCVNRILSGIRDLARGYIGTPFSSSGLLSLQQAIDGYLYEERVAGYHQGANCTMSYTRQDRILGRLTLNLKMVPPFSIETITVSTSLAAEESEL